MTYVCLFSLQCLECYNCA